ncbi:invasion associated locus B family protein [Tropicimonas sp.]|uniref:invasion associated locus B family protein n=1 Tax=Tropicimonas sp. TaxID=2067044 RepID=UPI003A87E822
MTRISSTSLTALALAAFVTAGPVFAQDAATEPMADSAATPAETAAPAEAPAATEAPASGEASGNALNLNMGTPAGQAQPAENALGQPYVKEVSGDWEIHCIRTGLEADPCALHQLLRDGDGNAVATIEVVNLPAGQQAAAGATIMTPLETLLTEQITLTIDNGQGRKYPFSFCTQRGCVSRVGFAQAAVDAFKRGNQASLMIVPIVAPDQQVVLGLSLSGFTAGYDTLVELNTANAAAIEKVQAEQQSQGAN